MFAFLGGAPLGGLLAGWLTARGGTPRVRGSRHRSHLVAVIGAAVVLAASRRRHEVHIRRHR